MLSSKLAVVGSLEGYKILCWAGLALLYSQAFNPTDFLQIPIPNSSEMPSRPITNFCFSSGTAVPFSLSATGVFPGGRVGSYECLVGDWLTHTTA